MKRTKPWKVAGIGEVHTGVWMRPTGNCRLRLTRCYNRLWENERSPKVFMKGLVVKVFQKGNLHECNNGRGMTSLPAISKIFLKTLLGESRKEQARCPPKRSTPEPIFILT